MTNKTITYYRKMPSDSLLGGWKMQKVTRKAHNRKASNAKPKHTNRFVVLWVLIGSILGNYFLIGLGHKTIHFIARAQEVSTQLQDEGAISEVSAPIEPAGQTAPSPSPNHQYDKYKKYFDGEEEKRVFDLIIEIWGDDAEVGLALAACECGFNQTANNPKSTALGVYQFLQGTWKAERERMGRDTDLNLRYDAYENILTGYSHFQRNGLHQPWAESVNCVNSIIGN